ncbi:MAG: glycoside hydrolase family 3 N-terminal domain-containing protein, partial [Longimicrobiales bacterium]
APSPGQATGVVDLGSAPTPDRGPGWYDGRSWARATLDSMTLEQKVGQMMMPILMGDFAPTGSVAHRRARRVVEDHNVGGIIVSVGSPTEVAAKLNWMQELSDLPLLVGADLEGGAGFRFDGVIHVPTAISLGGATRFPSLMAVGASGEPALAYEMGRITALEARAVGVHVPFAPVLDVNNNPGNPIINVRSFGEDPARVALLGEAFVRGVQEHGAIATAKHFPGHGDTGTDSHLSLPVIRVDRARMDSVELVPFQRAINAGLGAIMTAHISVPQLTGARLPATLSSDVMTDLLRDEMGFEGLVFTDAMDMFAIDRMFGREEATIRAIEAGADVILMPPDIAAAKRALVGAVGSGRLTEERIDASVLRILQAKESAGLHVTRTVDLSEVAKTVGISSHTAVAQALANRSVTVIKNDRSLLPLRGRSGARVLSVTYRRRNDLRAGRTFNSRLRQTYPRLRSSYIDSATNSAEYAALLSRARSSNLTIVSLHASVRNGAGTASLPDGAMEFVRELAKAGAPSVVVAFGNPYLLSDFPEVRTYMTAWSGVPVAERAAADAILGRFDVAGHTPTRIPPFDMGFGIRIPARTSTAN